jgi:hypothetical protein
LNSIAFAEIDIKIENRYKWTSYTWLSFNIGVFERLVMQAIWCGNPGKQNVVKHMNLDKL